MRRCTGTGVVRGWGGGPAGRAERSRRISAGLNGLGRVRSGSRVSGSKNIRVCSSTRMLTRRPARISAASTTCWPRETVPAALTVRSTSTGPAGPPWGATGRGAGPAGRPPVRSRAARSLTDRWERTDLSRTPATSRWMTSVSAQKVRVSPERAGPSQNCLPATCRFPDGGTMRSNSTAPPSHRVGGAGTCGAGAAPGAGTRSLVPRTVKQGLTVLVRTDQAVCDRREAQR